MAIKFNRSRKEGATITLLHAPRMLQSVSEGAIQLSNSDVI